MKKTITLLCLVLSIITFGQTDADLLGKWKFKEVAGQEKMDEESLKMLKMFFSDMSLYFDDQKRCKMYMMGKAEQGTWSLADGGKTLNVQSEKGRITELEITSVSQNELTIKLGKKGEFTLAREEVTEEDKLFEEKEKIETVSATKEQIAKTWYPVAKENPNRTEEENQLAKDLLEGSFLKIKSNGSYSMEFILAEKGTWEFNEDKTTITLTNGGKSQIWYIGEISESKMVLYKGKKSSRYEFSTQKP